MKIEERIKERIRLGEDAVEFYEKKVKGFCCPSDHRNATLNMYGEQRIVSVLKDILKGERHDRGTRGKN